MVTIYDRPCGKLLHTVPAVRNLHSLEAALYTEEEEEEEEEEEAMPRYVLSVRWHIYLKRCSHDSQTSQLPW